MKQIKTIDVLNWLGDDNWDKEKLAYILAEVANGEYKPEQLRHDIDSYEYYE